MNSLRLALLLAMLLMVQGDRKIPSRCKGYKYKRKVWVSNTNQYAKATRNARPGDMIIMKNGKYDNVVRGSGYHGIGFNKKKATKWRPITLCGSRNAVIDGKNGHPYGILVQNSQYINIIGVTVRNVLKGIRFETVSHSTLDGVFVTNTKSEAIHIQYRSHYNTVKNSKITNTGRTNKGVGEGIYLGSSSKNVKNDVCKGNKILYNTIGPGVTAEPIDVKENTRNGLVKGNKLDGKNLCGCKHAVSLINVKGNGYRIEKNIGKNAKGDFFKTSKTIKGEGRNNTFKDNKCQGKIRGGHKCVKLGQRGNKMI